MTQKIYSCWEQNKLRLPLEDSFCQIENKRWENLKIVILAIVFAVGGTIAVFELFRQAVEARIPPFQPAVVSFPDFTPKNAVAGLVVAQVAQKMATTRTVTAYNLINWQTDNSPCISANGENICLALELGYKRCASNEFPFGTRLYIQNYGECMVTDRTNSRYVHRLDVAMKASEIEKAKQFGIQNLEITILN